MHRPSPRIVTTLTTVAWGSIRLANPNRDARAPAIEAWEEVIRIASFEGNRDAGLFEQLRRHQAEQICAGGRRQVGRTRKGPLGSSGPSNNFLFFENENVESPFREHQRRNETIMSGADDDDISA